VIFTLPTNGFDKLKNQTKYVAGYRHGRVPRAVREQQILDIAERQFIDKGYDSTTVESVRLEAGVSRPIIYDYYGSKEQLYLACVRRARQQYQDQLQAMSQSSGTPIELIRQACDLYLSIVEANPRRWLVLFSGSVVPAYGELGDALADLRQDLIDTVVELIKANAPNTNNERAEAIAQAIFAVGEHFSRWWLRRPDIPKERMVGHLTEFLLQGLFQLVPGNAQLEALFE